MRKIKLCKILTFVCLSLASFNLFAWDHSAEIGYGYSHDPNHTRYNNYGLLVTSDLFPLKHTEWTFWSVTGSLVQWHTTTPQNKNLNAAALSLALRLYPFTVERDYPAYLLGSVGPALLSSRKFGYNTQAKNITIQTNIGFGVEMNPFDINLRLAHFSNAHLSTPNEGFNVLYVLSLGYLF